MITFPGCKINIGLNVLEKRQDGYHSLETVFYPVSWTDLLEIVPAGGKVSSMVIKSTGIRMYGPREKNLCMKAYMELSRHYSLPPVKSHLHKIVPIGAGLGGGSADAAHTLLLLNKLFRLGMSDSDLESIAAELGSDCPFFIKNKAVIASGRGEIFEPLNLKLKNYFLTIVKPRVHVSTAEAYSGIQPRKPAVSLKELIRLPIDSWKENISNDFEDVIFNKYPSVAKIKQNLYKLGAVYASMSGSGSAVYGIFKEEKNLSAYFRSCTVWHGKMN
ncbi:MAG: 4-(cytidine 5'-diphospho)-2-C-methyl-D-erythritol kinase [Bacteroidetes bacterium]|nr:MAG: 4-(cytidine 5'-diphospho)-2-C-methyl-D-erythritol kinase [Bacteroidota bacterium]REK08117.1 MAG: 4-(cytidine 5'-diphospho)-2-C-methyl-D-erythritol kinase [Bacteroidota bacterium]REK32322.1 MAG: 4-(cytidine 5'-diphospho)-2-C-methyl-D-erythritol kinase [Bacteroidota bacterium]REK49556.1 MAG: 4-(cytidine 5'-diphospho)-2-C-methyl-D-erythritol kinase [Bacteroidota bacterium]